MANQNIIFPSEASVEKYMLENNISRLRLYKTAYVNHMGQQDYGFSHENINSDYYYKQKAISNKTKTFNI